MPVVDIGHRSGGLHQGLAVQQERCRHEHQDGRVSADQRDAQQVCVSGPEPLLGQPVDEVGELVGVMPVVHLVAHGGGGTVGIVDVVPRTVDRHDPAAIHLHLVEHAVDGRGETIEVNRPGKFVGEYVVRRLRSRLIGVQRLPLASGQRVQFDGHRATIINHYRTGAHTQYSVSSSGCITPRSPVNEY